MASGGLRAERVATSATAPLRARVLRPGRPVAAASWPGWDDEGSITFAVRAPIPGSQDAPGVPVSTGSVRPSPCPTRPAARSPWQLRGMATDEGWRNRGAGRLVLDAIVHHVEGAGGDVLWCNARTTAIAFYAAAGFAVESDEFDIAGIGPHRVLVLPLTTGPADRTPR